jgi:hypothetical protein
MNHDDFQTWARHTDVGQAMRCSAVVAERTRDGQVRIDVVTAGHRVIHSFHLPAPSEPAIPADVVAALDKIDVCGRVFSDVQEQIEELIWGPENGTNRKTNLRITRNRTRDGVYRLDVRSTRSDGVERVFEYTCDHRDAWNGNIVRRFKDKFAK